MEKSYSQCKFTTKFQSNLIRHQKNTHRSVATQFKCECPYATNSKYNMELHRTRFRELGIDCYNNFSQRIICPVCGSKYQLRNELRQHIVTDHNETIEEENIVFESDSELFE
uniref:C2H2-type domain-containing protein n=1 Tax=Schizaphis graminum TaxID=13262 RepID=A0A2S2N9J0_SCHGA